MSSVRVVVEVGGRVYSVEREAASVSTMAGPELNAVVRELDEAVKDLKAALRVPPAPHPAL